MATDSAHHSALEGPPAPLRPLEGWLAGTEQYLEEVVSSDFPFVSVLSAHILRAGGKRLRVALPYLAAQIGGRASDEDVRKLGAAIELTHVATLHHDDVIDEADTRHGVPSVNANWTNTLAVLSGDFLFAKSSELAAEIGGEVPVVLAQTIAALCEGQIREIEWAFRTDRSPAEYLAVIERKTARLLSSAAYLGARIGGATDEVCAALREYGLAFGIAFQVADDLLDFLGDEKTTGKPRGTDLKEGVYTLPLLHALGKGEDAQVRGLLEGEPELGGIVRALEAAGSFGYARAEAERYAAQAKAALGEVRACPERDTLESLVDFVIDRLPVSPAA